MDSFRFDRFARGLAGPSTRRGALAGLLGGLLLPLVPGLPGGETEAKPRRKKQDRHRGAEARDDGDSAREQQVARTDRGDLEAAKSRKKPKKCKAPRKQCGKKCVAVKSDRANCGGCGNRCATGQACAAGVCTCAGSQCTGCCDSVTCQAGTTDQQCGTGGVACAVCTGGRSCRNGACACPDGQDFCGGACVDQATDPNHCGACGNVCPGLGQSTANVACQSGTCTFSCQGQNYDVNNNPANGCEEVDAQGNHTRSSALSLGSRSCLDTEVGSFSGTIYSDSRAHANPPAEGFDPEVGAAPLWFRVTGSGGFFCQNNPGMNLTLTSGTMNDCYKVTVDTGSQVASGMVVNGRAVFEMNSGSYRDGDTIFFRVEKTCPATVGETASFTASYHL